MSDMGVFGDTLGCGDSVDAAPRARWATGTPSMQRSAKMPIHQPENR
ncbi:MAG: hypothetical protein ACO363_08380 [Balneolaceae bacterium]